MKTWSPCRKYNMLAPKSTVTCSSVYTTIQETQDSQAPGAESHDNSAHTTNVVVVESDQAPVLTTHEMVVIIRPSFKKICRDACMAALLNHILFWIAWKSKDTPRSKVQAGTITYYASNKELVSCMADSWSEKKVRNEVNALIELGVLGVTKNQKWKMDRTKHFYFGRDQYNKLIELCNKYHICLAHIGLPKEVIQMLAAFGETVHCSCLGHSVNLLKASGKFTECNESNLPNASGKNDHSNNKDNYKDNYKGIDKERTNRGQQKTNVVDQQDVSHSSTRSSSSSQNISDPDEKQKEVILTEGGQRIFDFACSELFKAKKPEITPKLKGECEELASHVKTLEQFQSLLQFVRANLKPPYHLKNMVNALNDWLQIEEDKRSASADIFGNKQRPSVLVSEEKNEQNLERLRAMRREREAAKVQDVIVPTPAEVMELPEVATDVVDEYSVKDDDINEKVQGICMEFQGSDNATVYINEVWAIKHEFSVSNGEFFEYIFEARRWAIDEERTMSFFLDKLHGMLARAYPQAS